MKSPTTKGRMLQKFQPQKIRRKISLYFGGEKKFQFSLKEN
jgi:hypothetical protein